MKAKYPERTPVLILMGLCIALVLRAMMFTYDPVALWMLLGIEIGIIIFVVYYLRKTSV